MAGSTVTEKTATSSIAVILSLLTLMAAVGKDSAAAQTSCNSVLVSLSPCLNYITGNDTTPSKGCCSALDSVTKSNVLCLCQLLGGNNPLGIPINQTRALALPAKCKVSTTSVSQCRGLGSPTTSPSPSSGSPSDSGSTNGKATPGSNPNQRNAASRIFLPSVVNIVAGMILAVLLS
ncbi:hypothetical protein KI387_044072 [Taxus chinensis]|uniref:Bifunctional inhibitor/plant lipid transfer protein/seed storage helical domain-containing protein n=1 Tax=Taxus chinensis TaxID=29808 RepID=A0AA38G1E1_TAXCH|nr:hypothetical protein KI387_044072 [Taxus chinensis]